MTDKDSFKLNDEVFVVRLNKIGKITKVSKNNEYTVAVNNLQIQCTYEQLASASEYKTKHATKPESKRTTVKVVKRSKAPTKLDLHGYLVAYAISALEDTLNECVLSGAHELEIIHGIGTGKVKEAVLQYLKTSPLIRNYKEVMGNPGTTRAFF